MQMQFLILNNVRKLFSLSCELIWKCHFQSVCLFKYVNSVIITSPLYNCHKKTYFSISQFSKQCAITLFWIILAQYSNVQHTNYWCQTLFVLTSCDQVCKCTSVCAYLNKSQQWTILYNLLNNIENSRQVVETNLIPFGAENLTFNCEKINVDILQNISLLISHLKPSGTGLEWRINLWRINYLFLVIYDFKSVTSLNFGIFLFHSIRSH